MIVQTGPKFDKVLKKNPTYRQMFDKLKKRIEGPPELTEQNLRDMDGTNLEPIITNPPYQSIRISNGTKLRAHCLVKNNIIEFLDLPESHEKSYKSSLVRITAYLLQ